MKSDVGLRSESPRCTEIPLAARIVLSSKWERYFMDDEIRPILVATDLSSEALSLFEHAAEIAREHNSEIVLVHVIEPLQWGIARWYEPTALLEEYAENARNKLQELERQALTVYPRCRCEIHFGMACQVIADLAKKLRSNLIVISAHPRSGIIRRLLGGLRERLERRASCPVLAVECAGSSKKTAGESGRFNKKGCRRIDRWNKRLCAE